MGIAIHAIMSLVLATVPFQYFQDIAGHFLETEAKEIVLYNEIPFQETFTERVETEHFIDEAEVSEEVENEIIEEESESLEEDIATEKILPIMDTESPAPPIDIQLTSEPRAACETQTITIGDIKIAACNIGATVAGTWTDSYGHHFQRGRNVAFSHLANWSDAITTASVAGPQSLAMANGHTDFIKNASSPYDRLTIQDANLRWGGSDVLANGRSGTNYTERQGPCPAGFHVPSAGERSDLIKAWVSANPSAVSSTGANQWLWKATINTNNKFVNDTKIPLAGYRDSSNASVGSRGSRGYYWSSSPSTTNSRYFAIDPSNVYADIINYRTFGFPLRCFQNPGDPEPVIDPTSIQLTVEISTAGQTATVNKYFANTHTINRWDGSTTGNLTVNTGHTYATPGNYIITLTLTGTATRWTFGNVAIPLVPKASTTANNVYVSHIPALSLFGVSATSVGDFFFRNFNNNGALTSLPSWSFDTNHITTVGNGFFQSFNNTGYFTSLPIWSFDISNITTIGTSFFQGFNYNGSLTSLPTWSFQLSSWLTTVQNNFFNQFNYGGSLVDLPSWSFNTSNITTVGGPFFSQFNYNGSLETLPVWSFDTSNISGSVGNDFFSYFNFYGSLTSLPSWSFNISKITTAAYAFFGWFNNNGRFLTSLPAWSFDTNNITSVGTYSFYAFNNSGSLTSLPAWSFDMSNITTVADNFFWWFNSNGKITTLPTSFQRPTLDVTKVSLANNFQNAFNSPFFTIDRSAPLIVNGAATPNTNRATFSDNQPDRCMVHNNWLVNPCTISIIDLNYTPSTPTNGPVTLTVTATGGTKIYEYSFDNWTSRQPGSGRIFNTTTSWTIIVRDSMGREASIDYDITNIDETPVICNVSYDPSTSTTGSVLATLIECNKPVTITNTDFTPCQGGASEVSDGLCTFTENGTFTFEYVDAYGNTGTTTAIVDRITKPTPPTGGWWGKRPDYCPDGDFSPSRYDRTCGEPPVDPEENTDNENNEHNSANDENPENNTPSKDAEHDVPLEYLLPPPLSAGITRAEMAKLVSIYSYNHPEKKPDHTKYQCKLYTDLDTAPEDLRDYVITACELGLMGYYSDGITYKSEFSPNEIITKAEVVTVLSRMLRENKYAGTEEFRYHSHILAIYKAGIIENQNNPFMKETRGNVIMMMDRLK